ncbi:hypothetical protein CW731_00160 [Polaribacter sp. ALD11]|uniref:hypothetical protein n=1 Tax=Polaribacter sp. ALD11 TaxID=2058137 RepID=UPI000C303697|nr:hypothetical protein [Polaribacter sp. ALD11]AUC86600.1 hypothetical protein CW731_00160 [Polaribacter sp. ALD11]
MKYLAKIGLFLVCTFLIVACEQHFVEYESTQVNDGTTAQFQLHYMVPMSGGNANSINMVELNERLLTNETSSLPTFSYIPRGAVGKFFTTESGIANLKLHKGAVANLDLVYNRDIDLPVGKSNVIIHSFDEAPIIIENKVPYPTITTANTGETAWVKYYNILYEAPGVPTLLKLQYQYQYTTDNETGDKSDWINVGNPVAFGEATEWEPVTVNKRVEVSSGNARIDYRIRLIGQDGSDQGNLQVTNSRGNTVEYSDWWTAYVGRVYHHMFTGYRVNSSTLRARVRQSTAL